MDRLSIYERILNEYEEKKNRRERQMEERKKEVYKKLPIIERIDREIDKTAINAGKAILRGEKIDPSEKLEELKAAKISNLLTAGIDPEYLQGDFECEKCKDTGFVDGEECSCFTQRLAEEYYKMSNLDNILEKENFQNFDFNLFSDEIIEEENLSPRENISKIVRASQMFIKNFDDPEEKNLLFYGSTGLGKTFMLSCIAKELLDLGYTVIYQTAHNILGVIEEYRFNKTDDIEDAKRKYDYLFSADLLIIDDLGTETANTFTNSEIFNILNTRDLNNKKILISTNLTPSELVETYTDRIYSRILEGFYIYKFIGSDLRW